MCVQICGGMLIVVMVVQGVDGWDVWLFCDSFMIVVGQGVVFDCLIEVNVDGMLSGELVIYWEVLSDVWVWMIDLCQGVLFYYGQMLVVDDVFVLIQWYMSDDVIFGVCLIVLMIEKMDKLFDY